MKTNNCVTAYALVQVRRVGQAEALEARVYDTG
jgi:hypothetical protein